MAKAPSRLLSGGWWGERGVADGGVGVPRNGDGKCSALVSIGKTPIQRAGGLCPGDAGRDGQLFVFCCLLKIYYSFDGRKQAGRKTDTTCHVMQEAADRSLFSCAAAAGISSSSSPRPSTWVECATLAYRCRKSLWRAKIGSRALVLGTGRAAPANRWIYATANKLLSCLYPCPI